VGWGLRVQSSGFRVQGLGFRQTQTVFVQGAPELLQEKHERHVGHGVNCLRVWGFRFGVRILGCRVQG